VQSLIIRVQNQGGEMGGVCDAYIRFEVPIQNSGQKIILGQVT